MDYTEINLDDYTLSGEGGNSLVYSHKDGHSVAKLFTNKVDAEGAAEEFNTSLLVYEMGIPTPRPIRLVSHNGQLGQEFERIENKRSYARIFSQEPQMIEPLSQRMAQMTRQIHATPADTSKMISMKERVYSALKFGEPSELKERMARFTDTIPDKPICLHGDINIGNIITDGKRTMWIDVGDFSYGVPEWDLAWSVFFVKVVPENICLDLFHVGKDVLQQHWTVFLNAYTEGMTDKERADFEESLTPYMAVRSYTFFIKNFQKDVMPHPMNEIIEEIMANTKV